MREGWSRYQNSTGADSPKTVLETEDHVPRAEHVDPIKSCLIRDDLHVRAHLPSKGHLLTPALKGIRRTRAGRLLQWHAEDKHENILFTDEKFFTSEEQYNNQNKNIYAQTSLYVHSEGAGMQPHFLRHGLVRGVPSGGNTFSFLRERCENWCPSASRGRGTRSCETAWHDTLQWSGTGLPVGLSTCPKAKTNQEWLRRNVPAFISAEDWPSGSLDLNPRGL